MAWWWVNHKQTRADEVGGGYLWSPTHNRDGSRNVTYENMERARVGDMVFSYAGTWIGAIGVVTGLAQQRPKPFDDSVGANWAATGWFVPVTFRELHTPLRPREHLGVIAPLLPGKFSPLRSNGNGNQKFYLLALTPLLGETLLRLSGQESNALDLASDAAACAQHQAAHDAILADASITSTEKEHLILARLGAGLFRARVLRLEGSCRLTGVSDHQHLRASHIKPWRSCRNQERLDGNNGLALAPHVDHLFDRGFISFEDNGGLIVSARTGGQVLRDWGLAQVSAVAKFRPAQHRYLDYHRANVLK